MEKIKPPIETHPEIQVTNEPDVHGLCDLAEAYWGVFITKTEKRYLVPKVEQCSLNGIDITYLQKGKVSMPYVTIDFVGEETLLIINSSVPELVGSILAFDKSNNHKVRKANPIRDSIPYLLKSQNEIYRDNARTLQLFLENNFSPETAATLTPLELYTHVFPQK